MTARPEFSPIAPLAPTHEVGAFVCGDTEIDHFLHHRAASEQAVRLSQIYVTTTRTENAVIGYFTLSPIAVRIEPQLLATLGIGTAPYPQIGGFLLGRLGVHTAYQGRGIGKALVMRTAQIAKAEAMIVGGAFLAVDAKTDALVGWYTTLDFVRLSDKTRRLALPFVAVPSSRGVASFLQPAPGIGGAAVGARADYSASAVLGSMRDARIVGP